VNQGERAARERVDAVYAAVDRLTPEDLSYTVLPRRDLEERTILLADLEREVDRFGRGALLDEARARLRDALLARVGSRAFHAESGVVGITSIGRADDIAAVALAVEDAVSVALLADAGRRLLGLAPLEGSSTDPVPEAGGWEPTPADWAAAAGDGVEVVDHEEPMAGSRDVQAWLFAALGGFGVLVAIAAGITTGEWLLAVLGAVAVVGLAWTLATYHRPITRP
jgi:hypothetical protein